VKLCAPDAGDLENAMSQAHETQNHDTPNFVIGPTGARLTLADLPPPGAMHWVDRRKAEVVAAVRGGLISFEEARSRYMLSAEEFITWQKLAIGERSKKSARANNRHH
jgi:hypothetical protein